MDLGGAMAVDVEGHRAPPAGARRSHATMITFLGDTARLDRQYPHRRGERQRCAHLWRPRRAHLSFPSPGREGGAPPLAAQRRRAPPPKARPSFRHRKDPNGWVVGGFSCCSVAAKLLGRGAGPLPALGRKGERWPECLLRSPSQRRYGSVTDSPGETSSGRTRFSRQRRRSSFAV